MRSGDMLGQRYRLDERVDGGAMGEVFRGTDTRLSRTVAVKVLHASLSSTESFRRRFAAEARAAAALRAPGVVDLYDYGEDAGDDGTTVPYLVMEFVAGRALSTVLADRGRMSPAETMTLVAECAKALDAAHRAGVIHRDVKPGNILLRDEGGIKVVDFGIARAHGESGLTGTGQVMGTVAYVSPEQLYDETLTGASDIYSLGIVAYECLAGHKPFQADAPAGVIRAQLNQPPPPLPADVPESVAAVVMRCLAKEPGERWSSGAELSAVCIKLVSQLPPDDSTQPMNAVDQADATVRLAVPEPVAGADRSAPAVARTAGSQPPETARSASRAGSVSTVGRKQVVGALIGLVLLLALVATMAWRFWDTERTADPRPPGETGISSETPSRPPATGDDRTVVDTEEPGDDEEWPSSLPEEPSSPTPDEETSSPPDEDPEEDPETDPTTTPTEPDDSDDGSTTSPIDDEDD